MKSCPQQEVVLKLPYIKNAAQSLNFCSYDFKSSQPYPCIVKDIINHGQLCLLNSWLKCSIISFFFFFRAVLPSWKLKWHSFEEMKEAIMHFFIMGLSRWIFTLLWIELYLTLIDFCVGICVGGWLGTLNI